MRFLASVVVFFASENKRPFEATMGRIDNMFITVLLNAGNEALCSGLIHQKRPSILGFCGGK